MAISYTPLDEETYLMHRLAAEGKIFYKNELTEPANVKTFFPEGESQEDYDIAPKISFPVTGDAINRLASLLFADMEITCESPVIAEKLTKIQKRNDWKELSRDLFIKPMSGGNHLVVFRADWGKDNKPSVALETWPGEFVFKTGSGDWTTLGYMYLYKDGKRQPITSAPTEKDFEKNSVVIVYITDEYFSWHGVAEPYEHNFGFLPAVFFRAIDKDDDSRYGIPYHMRFRELLLEYNKIASQASKAIRILQNVWISDKGNPNPNERIRIAPDKVFDVGHEGFLKQAARELNLSPEFGQMDRLKAQISASAQVPDFMTGLRDVGKVESGVALAIVSSPLQELVGRIVESYKPKVTEVMEKAVLTEFALEGKRAPAFELECTMNPVVIPTDKQKEIDNLETGVRNQIISPEEARQRYIELMSLDYLLESARGN